KRAAAAHEAREVLDAPRAGAHTCRRLRLAENRRLSRSKAHVAGQHELAAACANAALDLRDGDQAACAEIAKHQANRCLSGQLCRLCPVLLDLGHVDMGYKIVGIGALKHEHLDSGVSLGALNEGDKIAD